MLPCLVRPMAGRRVVWATPVHQGKTCLDGRVVNTASADEAGDSAHRALLQVGEQDGLSERHSSFEDPSHELSFLARRQPNRGTNPDQIMPLQTMATRQI